MDIQTKVKKILRGKGIMKYRTLGLVNILKEMAEKDTGIFQLKMFTIYGYYKIRRRYSKSNK